MSRARFPGRWPSCGPVRPWTKGCVVSGFDGQDLGQQVDRALATIAAGPTPAAAIVARGRRIRRRRRAAQAGAVAGGGPPAGALPGPGYTAVRTGAPGPPAPPLSQPHTWPIAR